MAYLLIQSRDKPGEGLGYGWERGMIVGVYEDGFPQGPRATAELVRIDMPGVPAPELRWLQADMGEVDPGGGWRPSRRRWMVTPALLTAAEASGGRITRSLAQLEAALVDRRS